MTPRPQHERILAVLGDGDWHSFDEIKSAVGAPFSMLERRGELKRMGYEVERRGEWYRLLSPTTQARRVLPHPARRAAPLSAVPAVPSVPEIKPWKDHGLWSIRA